MKKNPYQEHWNEAISLLKQAREILGQSDGSVDHVEDAQFQEYLSHNELELALDEIESLSDDFELPMEFWQLILRAANRMGLKEHSKRYMKFLSYY